MVESMGICDRLAAEGKFVAAAPLEPVATAATVRVRDGQVLVTDGPFAETTEQLGGFYLLELAHLDEAIAVAGVLPPASKGTVEIRPLFPLEGLPPARELPEGGDEGGGGRSCSSATTTSRRGGRPARTRSGTPGPRRRRWRGS